MRAKRCPRCEEVTLDFQPCRTRPDGLDVYCRACRRAQARERYARQSADPARVEQRRAKRRRRIKQVNRARGTRGTKDWARKQVLNAVARGTLVKPSACEGCGEPTPKARLHGHHADYAQPLSVAWLCGACHRELHAPECRS